VQNAWIDAVVLMAARLGALVIVAPPLASSQVPALVRMGFVVAMAASLSLCLPGAQLAQPLAFGDLISSVAGELAVGLPLALGVAFAFTAFTAGGQILDIQVGFGMSQLFDPMTRQRLPVLATAFGQLATISFFILNSHHALLRAVALSVERYPLGQPFPIGVPMGSLIGAGASMFALGFAIVAPVVFCLLLAELGLGVLGRNLPQVNIFAISLPIKVIVGLIGLAAWLVVAAPMIERLHNAMLAGWKGWLS